MKALLLLLAFAPNLMALEITTLDGKTYTNCVVSKVYPDSICVLFSGSGARVKFTNLPESIRVQYGYDPQRAAAFEQAEAARIQREQALLAAQRQRAAQQRALAVNAPNQPSRPQGPGYGNTGSEYVGVAMAVAGPGTAYNQSTSAAGNQFGNQLGFGYVGAQYVGVRMAAIRSVTIPTPTQARPPGTIFGP
jgi:hypothetical protein